MSQVVILGSACAVSNATHAHTHLALVGQSAWVLVDCAGQPLLRLQQAGLDWEQLHALILTHFHPDHVCGVPVLLTEMWLRGRRRPLTIYGLPHCLERLSQMLTAFDWQAWPGLFPVTLQAVAETVGAPVLDNTDFCITAAPVRHSMPTLALRVTDKITGRTLAYSADTEPCPELVRLAQAVDWLLHEATGMYPGHSSAAQAGAVARQAGARQLVLIHYLAEGDQLTQLVPAAAATFGGPVRLAEDFMTLEL